MKPKNKFIIYRITWNVNRNPGDFRDPISSTIGLRPFNHHSLEISPTLKLSQKETFCLFSSSLTSSIGNIFSSLCGRFGFL